MTEREGGASDDPAFAMGRVNGEIRMLTEEEYQKAVAERDADEEVAVDEDDDLSDLDDLAELE